MEELVAKYLAFYHAYSDKYVGYAYEPIRKGQVLEYLKKSLENLNIKYEIFQDEDGIFIFQVGAKELDEALVS